MEPHTNPDLNANVSQNSPSSELQQDITIYNLTVEEASNLFHQGGVPRSVTTVTRFCRLGDLDCMRFETERNFKWLVKQSSVEKKIKELQQAILFTNKLQRDIASYNETNSAPQPVVASHDNYTRETEEPHEEEQWLRERVEELESENINLKIDKAAREQIINQMNTERRELITQIQNTSFKLGEATAKLQQIDAPRREEVSRPVTVAPDQEFSEAQVIQNTSTSEPEKPASVTPPEEKKGFFKSLFGQ